MKGLMTFEEIIRELDRILDELEARELSFNSVWSELTGYTWDELCDEAVEYIRMLGGTEEVI
jgi:hypothetical protein